MRRRKLVELAAIDPSLSGSAVAWGTADGRARHLHEHSSDACGMLVADRIARYEKLAYAVNVSTAMASVVFIEGYAYNKKGKHLDLAEYGSILRKELVRSGKLVVEIPPSTLKKFVTGNGNANKEKMLATVIRTMDEHGWVDTNNKADALALYRLGCIAIGVSAGGVFDETLSKKKQEAAIEANRLFREARRG
jgi:crossover junction endodeoxyribonuclease RuvC